MKKITLLLLLCSTFFYAQERVEKFELKKDGFPDYVVLEFPDKSANEIFTQVKKWAEYNIRNAETSNYSEIQDEYLTYTIDYVDAFQVESKSYAVLTDVEIRIKENKLRIDLNPRRIREKGGSELGISGGLLGILRKDGTQRKYEYYHIAFQGINDFANGVVADIAEAVKGKTDYKKGDW